MVSKLNNDLVYIKKSPIHGWGLFAIKHIDKNKIIAQAPGIIFGIGSYCPPEVFNYTFPFPTGGTILCLGFPSLINSSINSNSIYEIDELNNIVNIRAIQNINPDEEITLHYIN